MIQKLPCDDRRLIAYSVPRRPALGESLEWQQPTPKGQGYVRADKLARARIELAKRQTRAFVVVRNDNIVYEWYGGNDLRRNQGTARSLPRRRSQGWHWW